MEEYKDLTIEKIKEIIKSNPQLEDSFVREVTPGIFQIGKDGPITGPGGLDLFHEAMKAALEKEAKKYGK